MQFDSGDFEQDLGTATGFLVDEDSIWPTLYVNVGIFVAGALSTIGVDLILSCSRGERNSEKCDIILGMRRIWQRAWKADHKSIYNRPSIKFQMEQALVAERPVERMQTQVESHTASDSDPALTESAGDPARTEGARRSQTPGSGQPVRSILKSVSRHRLSVPAGGAVQPLTLPSPGEREIDGGAENLHAHQLSTPEARAASFHPGSASSVQAPATLQSSPEDHEADSGRAHSKSLPSTGGASLLTVAHPLEKDSQVTPPQKEETIPEQSLPYAPRDTSSFHAARKKKLVSTALEKREQDDVPVDAHQGNDESNDFSERSSFSSSSSSAGERPGMASKPTTRARKSIVPGLAAHTSYTNYLCFLKVCQAMFATLSLLSVIFTMPRIYWVGVRPFFGGMLGGRISLVHPKNSFEPDLDATTVVLLYIQTWTFGVVILIFTQLLHASCNDMPIVDLDVAEKINRTVWFKWLPTGDKRTRRSFLMSDSDMDRVANDLKYAIEERLTKIHWRQRVSSLNRVTEGPSTASWAEAAWETVSSMSNFNLRSTSRTARSMARSSPTYPSQAPRRSSRDDSVANHRRIERQRSTLPSMRSDEEDPVPMTQSFSEPRTRKDRTSRNVQGRTSRDGQNDPSWISANFSGFFQNLGDNSFTSTKSQTWRIEPKSLAHRQCVETVEVPPETAEWHETCMQLRDATERADSYSCMESEYRFLAWWYRRRARKCAILSKRLRTKLLKMIMHNKRLCGSAFVTFTSVDEKRLLISHDKPRWWDIKRFQHGYSHFTFGRPPFASVTLKCEPAPHPNDIQWANLHKSPLERQLRFLFGVVLITVFLVLLVTPNTLKGLFLYVRSLLIPERKQNKTLEFWFKKGITSSFARFLHVLWRPLVGRMLSLSLLMINSVVLPFAIEYLARAERCPRKSTGQHRELRLNFMFMVLNIVLMPMLQVTSVHQLMESLTDLTMSNGLRAVLGYVGDRMSRGHGVFTVQYLLNSTFISSSVALGAKLKQQVIREIYLAWFAVTDRDREASYTMELFAWGYWYAWALAIICMTMNTCVIVPGTLPIATLLFTLRYHIDRYNLDNGVYELGSESNGMFVRTVVLHMRLIVSMMWFLMGCFFTTDTCQAIGLHWISDFGSYMLCAVALVLGVANTYLAMYSFWWTKMADMYPQMKSGRLQAAQTRMHRFLHNLQDKLQLTKSIVSSEHLHGGAEDLNWKVLDTKEYIFGDSLVETMLEVLHERCREDGSFNFTTKNLEKYGLETSELTEFFDIDEGDEDEDQDNESDECLDSIELASYMDTVRLSQAPRRRSEVDQKMEAANTWSPNRPFPRRVSRAQTLQSLHV